MFCTLHTGRVPTQTHPTSDMTIRKKITSSPGSSARCMRWRFQWRSSVSWRVWQVERTTKDREEIMYYIFLFIYQWHRTFRRTSSLIPAVFLPSVLNGGFRNPLKCNLTKEWNVAKQSYRNTDPQRALADGLLIVQTINTVRLSQIPVWAPPCWSQAHQRWDW